MCECPPSAAVQLAIEYFDYFVFYGYLCACVRFQCRKCGSIILRSYYALERGTVTNQPVHRDGTWDIQPFLLTDEIRTWSERREAQKAVEKARYVERKFRSIG